MQSQTQLYESSTPVAKQTPENIARSGVYRLLATLLVAPPTAPVLDMIGRLDLVQPIDRTDSGETGLFDAWHALQAAAGKVSVAALDDEFHDLFIGISRGELLPYASWYLTGFLMEKPLADLRAELQALGLQQHEDVKEPEDHVAALCEAMALLIESADPGELRQRAFFSHHIQPWMSQLFVDMQAAGAAHFYRAVAYFGKSFLEVETRYLVIAV